MPDRRAAFLGLGIVGCLFFECLIDCRVFFLCVGGELILAFELEFFLPQHGDLSLDEGDGAATRMR